MCFNWGFVQEKTYNEVLFIFLLRCLVRWGDVGRGWAPRERGDYVNEMKRCRVCRSRVSPRGSALCRSCSCFSSSPLPRTPLVPHEWSCFSRTPACLGEARSPQTQTKHRQKPLTCNVLAREPGLPQSLSLSLLPLFTVIPLSFMCTHKFLLNYQTCRNQWIADFIPLMQPPHPPSPKFKVQKQIF